MKLPPFLKDEFGGAAAEYALIFAIVGLGVVAALAGLKKSPPEDEPAPRAAPAASR